MLDILMVNAFARWIFLRQQRKQGYPNEILTVLVGKELCAIQIVTEVKKRFGHDIWSGDLDPILYRLQAEGKISGRWSWPVPTSYPTRRLYKLTEPS